MIVTIVLTIDWPSLIQLIICCGWSRFNYEFVMSQLVLFTSPDLDSVSPSPLYTDKGWVDKCLRPILDKSGEADTVFGTRLKHDVEEDFYHNINDTVVLRKAMVYCLKNCTSNTISDDTADEFLLSFKDFFDLKSNIKEFTIGNEPIKERIDKRITDIIQSIRFEDQLNCRSFQERKRIIIRGFANYCSDSQFLFVMAIVEQLVGEVVEMWQRLETGPLDICRINETENFCYLLNTLRSVLLDAKKTI